VALARHLDARGWSRLLHLVQLMLREAPMEGLAGLELTEEMRVIIAATDCLLLVGLPYPRFARLRRVLVYPDTFKPRLAMPLGSAIPREPQAELGEAWRDGMVVLAWNSVRRGGGQGHDGHNVVLHEFAHLLDGEDGVFDGMPVLDTANQAAAWDKSMAAAFAALHAALDAGHETVLDPYAATNRSEFFAVATETFFETPLPLREAMPELYEQLRSFYQQDPAAHRP
jgi:Mlc titration factor MtfA (ptsG expression regulator)